jgi:hypothetical protein
MGAWAVCAAVPWLPSSTQPSSRSQALAGEAGHRQGQRAAGMSSAGSPRRVLPAANKVATHSGGRYYVLPAYLLDALQFQR